MSDRESAKDRIFRKFGHPRFTIGDWVTLTWESEHGELVTDRGLITGVFLAPFNPGDHMLPGWHYYVAWYDQEVGPLPSVPYFEHAPEEDLLIDRFPSPPDGFWERLSQPSERAVTV